MSRDSDFLDNIQDIVDSRLMTVNTQIPARVTAVNYEGNSLNAKPLIATRYSDEDQLEYPELFDIPFMIYSAQQGNARITIPIAVGDTVLVEFSQRDLHGFYRSDGKTSTKSFSGTPLGLYPIMAIPCLYTHRSARGVNESNIVIENYDTQIVLTPNGDINITGNVNITSDSVTHNGTNIGDTHTHPHGHGPGVTSAPS